MASVVLVTGATSGIGYATARELARAGWHVLLCGRDRSSADAAANRLRSEARAIEVDPVHCDHTRLADVSDLADRITEATRDGGLAAIILAAAVANPPGPRTVDGLDTTLTVNHLTPYLLRERLGPVLAANGGRVVLIGSSQHTLVKAADLDPAIFAPERAGAVQRYEVTKLLTLLTLRARQLAAQAPVHLGVDPGFVRTNLGRSASGTFRVLLKVTRPIQAPRSVPPGSSAGFSRIALCPTVRTSTRKDRRVGARSPSAMRTREGGRRGRGRCSSPGSDPGPQHHLTSRALALPHLT